MVVINYQQVYHSHMASTTHMEVDVIKKDYTPQPLASRLRRLFSGPAVVRQPVGWQSRAAMCDGDSFDRLHQRDVHTAAVLVLRGGK